MANQEEILIGEVTHYFGKIKVAIVKLSKPLKIGEEIKICGGETEFTQEVQSLEIDHQKLEEAKAGQSIGLAVKEKVHPGYKVYKV
jgi:translation elongation factor EF-Tu-like GTPase